MKLEEYLRLKRLDRKNGTSISETMLDLQSYSVSKQADYVARTVKDLKDKRGDFKLPVSSEQSESTKRLLAMSEEELIKHRERPLPKDWLAVSDATNMDEAVAPRLFTPQEVALVEDIRHKSKNTTGDAISEGQRGASKEAKVNAMAAFTCTPPAPLTDVQTQKLTEVTKIKEYEGPPPKAENKKSKWFQRFQIFADKPTENLSMAEKLKMMGKWNSDD